MAETIELKAASRDRTGKGAARATRREGLIPGVIYGDKKPPEPIQMDFREVWQHVLKGHFLTTICMIEVDGKTTRVIPRDIQLDPVRDYPLHVDFLRLGKDATITVAVPVHFINEADSPGLKRGGVLNIVRHDIDVICPAESIPDTFELDLTGLEIGDSIHSSAIELPEGVKLTITDRDFTVATIAGRIAEEEPEEAEEAELEGEEVEEVGEVEEETPEDED